MRWKGRAESENVEDRRSLGKAGLAIGGGGALILLIISLLLGVDPRQLLDQAPGVQPEPGQGTQVSSPEDEEAKQFVGVILKDTEDVWTDQFHKMGSTYRKPKLVLFSGRVQSACGLADAAVGPFYCPED